MLTQLAWKNIWRNKKRSLVIVLAIMFGLCGGLFSGAIMMGMAESMVDSAIDRYLGHIQIHSKEFNEDIQISHTLHDINKIRETIQSQDSIAAFSERTIIEGMAQSPASSFGVRIIGVDRVAEKQVTRLHEKVIEGGYLDLKSKNQILIGKKLAERLNLGIRKKVILTFQNQQGDIIYLACRISGIYKTESTMFDQSYVFVKQVDLLRSLQTSELVHEVAIRVTSSKYVDETAEKLSISDIEVL